MTSRVAGRVSVTVVDLGQPREAGDRRDERGQKHEMQRVEPGHAPCFPSKAMTSAPASSMRADAGSSRSGPGLGMPSGPATAAGIGVPSTDVPQLLTSCMKKRPEL